MDGLITLSAAQCILLSANLAADSNVDALRSLIISRRDVFDAELAYRVILTFLPESLESTAYVDLVDAVADLESAVQSEDVTVDVSSVQGLEDAEPRKLFRRLHLQPLRHLSIPREVQEQPLVQFLIHRAHNVDRETGLLVQVVNLLRPFLNRSHYLQNWFTSTVLPLLRLDYEYYPHHNDTVSLDDFDRLHGEMAIKMLMSRTSLAMEQGTATEQTVGRDLRGIVGPWVYGSSQRKRRKLAVDIIKQDINDEQLQLPSHEEGAEPEHFKYWRYTFEWITASALENFPLSVKVFEGWDGPRDIDLGERHVERREWSQEEEKELQFQYCRAAFASIYAVDRDTAEAVDGAHSILTQLATLMDFEPPPDLATSIQALPRIARHSEPISTAPIAFLQFDALLKPDNPLTKPELETFSLLQMFVFSAYLFSGLGQRLSVVSVAKLCLWSDHTDQLRFLQRILRDLMTGSRKDEHGWVQLRGTLLWLWNWGLLEDAHQSTIGYGVFGRIEKTIVERECLQALCIASQFSLVKKIYLPSSENDRPLPIQEVEQCIMELAYRYYDNASNGNRTRGGVKKASDIAAAFSAYFPQSSAFRRFEALLKATHSLSFYSLALQHGVPFQPVSIRVDSAPISLIQHVLEQNPRSYSKLEDLIQIGHNLTVATLVDTDETHGMQKRAQERDLNEAERKVIGMAIEAALAEDDFETAYSYVVNRLNGTNSSENDSSSTEEDEISWRAAFHAGRYRSTPTSNNSKSNTLSSQHVRRLEQRMELLSQSLVLAPSTALPEVLSAWRRCEEELLTVLAQESEAEQSFNDNAANNDIRSIPGGFGTGDASLMQVQPKRKEIGRGVGEEAPMGLFEVARGAAAAFGKSGSRVAASASRIASGDGGAVSENVNEQRRARKRDMVANAVTGSLVTGLGWVLGATPAKEDQG